MKSASAKIAKRSEGATSVIWGQVLNREFGVTQSRFSLLPRRQGHGISNIKMVLAVLWLGVLLGAICSFILSYRFLGFLRNKHPDIWVSLGSPTLFFNNSLANNIAVMNVLRRRQYLHVGDGELTRRSRQLWILGRLYLLLFAVI